MENAIVQDFALRNPEQWRYNRKEYFVKEIKKWQINSVWQFSIMKNMAADLGISFEVRETSSNEEVMENYQQPDGSVVIPKALVPYMGGVEVIRKPE